MSPPASEFLLRVNGVQPAFGVEFGYNSARANEVRAADPYRQANVSFSLVRKRGAEVVGHTLIDVGMGVVPSLLELEARHGVRVVHEVLLTHPHFDHFAQLDWLSMNLLRNGQPDQPRPLPVYACPECWEAGPARLFPYLSQRVQFRPLRPGVTLDLPELTVVPFAVDHGPGAPGALGYVVQHGQRRVVLTGDFLRVPDEDRDLLRGADVCFLDANTWHPAPHTGHTSVLDDLRLIARWKPKRAYLLHYSGYEDREHPHDPINGPLGRKRFGEELRRAAPGQDVQLARHGMVLGDDTPWPEQVTTGPTVARGRPTYPYRVFVSYSHDDRALAERLVDVLKSLGLVPFWDRDIRPGTPFTDAIKEGIALAHLFVPLITERSQVRPWVHQEIGYAMGVNVPVLPVAIDTLPGELIAQLHAVAVRPSLDDLADRLNEVNLDRVVLPPPPQPFATTQVADLPETRTDLMVQHVSRLLQSGEYGRVRQRGLFSSFSLPREEVAAAVWDRIDGAVRRTAYHRGLLRSERLGLEEHARRAGCALILDPFVDFAPVGADVHRGQLQTLLVFLRSMGDDQVRIALSPCAHDGNLTLVGDWFVAQAVTPRPGVGYLQTIFTGHAPTVLRSLLSFDEQLDALLRASGVRPEDSRRAAIARLEERLASLPP